MRWSAKSVSWKEQTTTTVLRPIRVRTKVDHQRLTGRLTAASSASYTSTPLTHETAKCPRAFPYLRRLKRFIAHRAISPLRRCAHTIAIRSAERIWGRAGQDQTAPGMRDILAAWASDNREISAGLRHCYWRLTLLLPIGEMSLLQWQDTSRVEVAGMPRALGMKQLFRPIANVSSQCVHFYVTASRDLLAYRITLGQLCTASHNRLAHMKRVPHMCSWKKFNRSLYAFS